MKDLMLAWLIICVGAAVLLPIIWTFQAWPLAFVTLVSLCVAGVCIGLWVFD